MSTWTEESNGPLHGVRVIDITDGHAGKAGRFLAELGADVILVEPIGGNGSRSAVPKFGAHSIAFFTSHWNKSGVTIDFAGNDVAERVFALTDGADIVLESLPPGRLAEIGAAPSAMRARNSGLVVVSITGFGQTGPHRDWQYDESVMVARSSLLTRSGAPGREPLLPPGDFGSETAAVHAAYVALLAYFRSVRTGLGDYADVSLFDLVVQDLDPGLGMAGSATMGRSQIGMPPGRPDVRLLYPIVACADGYVRMFIAAPRHWHAMFEWLGKPDELSDPTLEQMMVRFMNWSTIAPRIAELLADKTREEIVAHGTEVGIPIASLNTPVEVMTSDHVRARESFVSADLGAGVRSLVPSGYLEYNRNRMGFRTPAPACGEHNAELPLARSARRRVDQPAAAVPARPLDGIRVLDLGVIVAGAETGRSLADQGAEVIKIESRAYPDGSRQADGPDAVSNAFAVGHRGKKSLGLDLRSDRGAELFRDLVAVSDVVLSNFKPGTMESLGFGHADLSRVNPRIITMSSSALGSRGPWSQRMGYGPLVRSTVGLTQLWRHPDSAEAFGDDATVFPDHAAGRVAAAAVTAALIDRENRGRGAEIEIAQMDVAFVQLAGQYLRESVAPGTMTARAGIDEFNAPSGVFEASGEDAYVVVSVHDDSQWRSLTRVIKRPDLEEDADLRHAEGRVSRRSDVDAAVDAWTRTMAPRDAERALQAAGVPAGAAVHVEDLLTDKQLTARRQIITLEQPGFDEPIPAEAGPALFESIPAPNPTPTPLAFQDSREVLSSVLGLDQETIDQLVADGVVEVRTDRGVNG